MRARMLISAAALATAATLGTAPLAVAQPRQEGLVNVLIEDVVVQVPIGVAANVCDVNVAVLAELGPDEAAPCEAAVMQDLPVAFRR